MGANICSLRHSNSEQQHPKAIGSIDQNASPRSSIIELITQACLKTEKMKKKRKKRQLQPPDQKKITKVKILTLEEWLLASPGLKPADCISGGELHVFKHFSKKVYPSSRPRDSFSRERLVKIDEGDGNLEVPSISRSQSENSKRRVSFRLPEVADIIIFYSSDSKETFEEGL